MTGYRSRHFRHKCAGDGCYVKQLPDWEDIIQRFPRNIRPTDIDGMVEINGHFLFLEEKSAGAPIESGQRMALKSLSRNPNTTVLVFRPAGKRDLEAMVIKDGSTDGFRPCSRTQFLHWIERWATHADSDQRSA